jgi:hypothetical protein
VQNANNRLIDGVTQILSHDHDYDRAKRKFHRKLGWIIPIVDVPHPFTLLRTPDCACVQALEPARNNVPNRDLGVAKAAKKDEFYTQYIDIEKEVEAYLEFNPDTFRGKAVYCNCDDPFESNFFKYFATNFNKLGLRKLITTSYDGSPIAGQGTLFPEYNEGNGKRKKPKALAVILDRVDDEDGDGAANVADVQLFLERNKAALT